MECIERADEPGWTTAGNTLLCGAVPGDGAPLHGEISGAARYDRMGTGQCLRGIPASLRALSTIYGILRTGALDWIF